MRTGLRHCLILATAAPTLTALRPAHDHARARARSSRTLHACEPRRRRTCSHIATRVCTSKARMACSCHWPLADCWSARCMRIWLAHALQMRSPPPLLVWRMRRSHVVHAMHHHRCHVCREMKTMNEMTTNDTMKKTKDTTDDARECAPLVPAPPMRSGALASTPRASTSRALATARAAQATTRRPRHAP